MYIEVIKDRVRYGKIDNAFVRSTVARYGNKIEVAGSAPMRVDSLERLTIGFYGFKFKFATENADACPKKKSFCSKPPSSPNRPHPPSTPWQASYSCQYSLRHYQKSGRHQKARGRRLLVSLLSPLHSATSGDSNSSSSCQL